MSSFKETFTARWGEVDPEFLAHYADPNYDPVKAREYYLRTRKLKGRKKGKKQIPEAVKKEYQGKVKKFLGTLPMAKEGADPKETAAFVNRMRKMSDDEMVAEAKKLANSPNASSADIAKVKTVNALLQNRARVRKSKGLVKADAKVTRVHEDGSVDKKAHIPKALKDKLEKAKKLDK